MKWTMFLALLLCATAVLAQTSLDNDPSERKTLEQFFAQPPASSVGSRPDSAPYQNGSTGPMPAPAPMARPPTFVRNQSVWLNATGEVVKRVVNAASADRTQELAVEFGTSGKIGIPARLEIVCLGTNPRREYIPVSGHHEPIIVAPPGEAVNADGTPQIQPIHFNYDSVSSRYGIGGVKLAGWIIRIVSPDGSVLAVKASDGSLESMAADPDQWKHFTSKLSWN